MNLQDYMLLVNERFRDKQRNGQPADDMETTRAFLLSLPIVGLTKDEIKKGLLCACNKPEKVRTWDSLRQEIYENYMIDIGADETHLTIIPCYSCYINLDTGIIGTRKPVDLFTSADNCVIITDYRDIDADLKWQEIASREVIE